MAGALKPFALFCGETSVAPSRDGRKEAQKLREKARKKPPRLRWSKRWGQKDARNPASEDFSAPILLTTGVQPAGGPWIQSVHGLGKPSRANPWAFRIPGRSEFATSQNQASDRTTGGQNDEVRLLLRPSPTMASIVLPLHDFASTRAQPSAERWGAKRCHREAESPLVSQNHGYKIMARFSAWFFASFRLFSATCLGPSQRRNDRRQNDDSCPACVRFSRPSRQIRVKRSAMAQRLAGGIFLPLSFVLVSDFGIAFGLHEPQASGEQAML